MSDLSDKKRKRITLILLLVVLVAALLAATLVFADHHRNFDRAVSVRQVPRESLASLDSLAWDVEAVDVGDYIRITGWALPLGRKLDSDLQVGLYRKDTGQFIGMTTFFQTRKDVDQKYGTGKYSYMYSGFQASIRADQAEEGKYTVMLIFGDNKYYDTGSEVSVGT